MYLKVRVTLETAQPRATRVVAIDPALTLDRMHAVIQASFGWFNSHLHQFTQRNCTLEDNKLYIYPGWDTEMLALAEFAGPEEDVTIGELLREVGDFCYYEYDFGDGWEHRLELEGLAEPAEYPYIVEGAGKTPEEDSRGQQSEEELPAHPLSDVTLVEISSALAETANPSVSADAALAFGRRVGPLLDATWERNRIGYHPELDDLWLSVMQQPITLLTPALEQELDEALAPWTDFLHAAGREIPLTQAGYLEPSFTAGFVEKWKIDAYTKSHREVDIPQMWRLHETAKAAKLTRKYRKTLRLSSLGKKALGDRAELIRRLISATLASHPEDFFRDAMMLALMLVATRVHKYSPSRSIDDRELEETVAQHLGEMGWRFDGKEPEYSHAWVATETLRTVLDPLQHKGELSPELVRYCAWHGLKAD